MNNFGKMLVAAETEHREETEYDFRLIFAVGTDQRIHILDHGNLYDGMEQDIEIIESDVTSGDAPGIYSGIFVDDGGRDFESGVWESEWNIAGEKLLYLINPIDSK